MGTLQISSTFGKQLSAHKNKVAKVKENTTNRFDQKRMKRSEDAEQMPKHGYEQVSTHTQIV